MYASVVRPCSLLHKLNNSIAICAALFCFAVLTSVPAQSQAAFNPSDPAGSGYRLIFDDEFNASSVNTSVWSTSWFSGAVLNNVCTSSSLVSEPGDGYLHLTLSSGVNCGTKYAGGAVTTNPVTTAGGGFQYTYGYVEWRVYLPGTGSSIYNWPAVWSTGQNWPMTGEIDTMEGFTNACYHFIYSNNGQSSGFTNPGGCANGNFTGWHTFANLWQPGSITYYYDGVQVGQMTQGITSSPLYLVMNVGQSSSGSGNGPTSAPSTMLVDYVHVYTASEYNTSFPTLTEPGSSSGTSSTGSASGTSTTAAVNTSGDSPSITDSSGNVWAINDWVVTKNGSASAAGFSADVVEIALVGGQLYQNNLEGGWWYASGTSTTSWVESTNPLPATTSTGTTSSTGTSGTTTATGASGTSSPPTSAAVVTDGQGNKWWIGTNGQIYENGVVDPITNQVTKLLYTNGYIYQENAWNNWYYWTGTAWVEGPAPTATTASTGNGATGSTGSTGTSGTTTATGSSSTSSAPAGVNVVTDGQGNKWWIGTNGQIYKNGVVDPITNQVTKLLYTNGYIYQENAWNNWYYWTGTAWIETSAPATTTASTGTGTTTTGTTAASCAGTADGQGNCWTVKAGVVYENGTTAGFSASVTQLVYAAPYIYQENSSDNWWAWENGGWVATTAPATTTASTGTSTGTTSTGTGTGSATTTAGWTTLLDGTEFASTTALWANFNNAYPWGTDHNGSARMYQSNVTTDGQGTLIMEATRVPATEGNSNMSPNLPIDYHSGTVYWKQQVVIDAADSQWTLEGDFQVPSVNATWPAFWVTAVTGWPPEVDMMEFKGSATVWQNTFNGLWPNETAITHTTNVSTPNSFHHYKVWFQKINATDVSVTYYVDGVQTAAPDTATNYVGKPMWLILDLQMEGSSGATGSGPAANQFYYAKNLVVKKYTGN